MSMKAEILGKMTVMENDKGVFNYFGWPSVTRLPGGKIAVAASGFRLKHVCPFGKSVMCVSDDECETFSPANVVMDTPLDDRDSGLTVFGNGRVMLTSFNNTIEFQRRRNEAALHSENEDERRKAQLIDAYLKYAEMRKDNETYLGSTYRISEDGGNTFGEIRISPVTCPHGPLALRNGELLYIGRRFSEDNTFDSGKENYIQVWKLNGEDRFEYVTSIANIFDEYGVMNSCEPHAIELPDGRIIVHIRVQRSGEKPMFTIDQAVSEDGGKTFSKPEKLLSDKGGSPAHLIYTSKGELISVYGYREAPYGLRFMVSADWGNTWDTDHVLYDGGESGDLGYPATVELMDGTLFTVYYENIGGVSRIYGMKWRLV